MKSVITRELNHFGTFNIIIHTNRTCFAIYYDELVKVVEKVHYLDAELKRIGREAGNLEILMLEK